MATAFQASSTSTSPSDSLSVDQFYPSTPAHNGASHPLSGYFTSLTAAKAFYPFATSLAQEVDYCACKLASNTAFGADGSEHGSITQNNKPLRIPAGTYVFGNDTWLIRNLASGLIYGDGKLATVLTGNNIVLGFDGVWYSELANFSVQAQTSSAVTALDIDGNVPGHPYATRGVQGVTLRNLYIDGGNSTYAFAMCRQGGGGAQGSECLFENVHLNNASFACYYQNGFNALANTFVGGNFQNYPQNGIYAVGGTIAVINTGFQSTTGYKQIENGGWDIHVGAAGACEGCLVYGCRTESLRFLLNESAVHVDVRACAQNISLGGWFASTAYGPLAPAYKAIVQNGLLYVATTAGTSGATMPTFPLTGTVADGTIVWTQTQFNTIHNLSGSVDRNTLRITAGDVYAPSTYVAETITANKTLSWADEVVICDTTAAAITVTLPVMGGGSSGTLGVDRGRQIIIRKSEPSAHAVTVSGPFEGGISFLTLAGGARRSVTLIYADEIAGGARSWQVVASH